MVGFYDRNPTQPSIETLVYEGTHEDDEHGFLFRFLNEEAYYFLPESQIGNVVDKVNLIKWLQREHSPQLVADTYEYAIS